jgi:hypothetical protein
VSEFDPDEETLAMLKDAAADHDAQTARILDFCNNAQNLQGPLGDVFREIADAFTDFRTGCQFGTTTANEETRMYRVVDAAVAALSWLRDEA